ncbi:hypothetical protein Pan241w_22820 [Gimesia alba]|uniref:Uncharacterized protein n=1 Tax=Gimesia alba TaxID=2527973 RepID=A0A517RE94_9PLAN|nr:hypothetical protein [Gimesia alba]QDT42201.1 hypothetical protein Pan241w_22820 [Gimesia alba]
MTFQPFQGVTGSLPGERDFDPHVGDLDARVAWGNFGGLTLAEAFHKFQKSPDEYQEDFMYMGGKAFAYYFPVLERYLMVTPVWYEDDGIVWCQILGLGEAIQFHFSEKCLPEVQELVPRVLALIEHVKEAVDVSAHSKHPYYSDPEIYEHVIEEWEKLEQHLGQFGSG